MRPKSFMHKSEHVNFLGCMLGHYKDYTDYSYFFARRVLKKAYKASEGAGEEFRMISGLALQ